MSRIRPTALVVYLVLLCGVLALILTPGPPQPPLSPKERWESFQQWLGKPPSELTLRDWPQTQNRERGAVFVFQAEEAEVQLLATKLELIPADTATEALRALLPDNTAAQTLHKIPEARLLCDNSYEWGYFVSELMLAQLDNQQVLLAIRYQYEDEDMNSAPCICAWHDEAPNREETSAAQTALAAAVVFSPFWIPLGILLLIRRFDFRKRSHYLIWYGVAILVPLSVYLSCIFISIPPSPTQAIALFTTLIFIMPVGIVLSAIVQLVARRIICHGTESAEKN